MLSPRLFKDTYNSEIWIIAWLYIVHLFRTSNVPHVNLLSIADDENVKHVLERKGSIELVMFNIVIVDYCDTDFVISGPRICAPPKSLLVLSLYGLGI